jgi:hypothetical protein
LVVQRNISPRIRPELPDAKAVKELFTGLGEAMLETATIMNADNGKGKENEWYEKYFEGRPGSA